MKKSMQKELDVIYKKKKILRPADVVTFAKNPKTSLHDYFEWDNTVAGEAHRLWQARQLIKVCVEIIEPIEEPIQVYTSLQSDREKPRGGYRKLKDIMKSKELRKELLKQALEELLHFERKYQQLKELLPVFTAIKNLKLRKRKSA